VTHEQQFPQALADNRTANPGSGSVSSENSQRLHQGAIFRCLSAPNPLRERRTPLQSLRTLPGSRSLFVTSRTWSKPSN